MLAAHRSAALVLVLAVPAPGSPRADTLTVGPSGSGAHFEEIQEAVDAASPGDLVLVAAGSYAPFELTKALDVVGAGPAATVIQAPLFYTQPAVRIADVAAGEAVFLAGLKVQSPSGYALFDFRSLLEVVDVEGDVVLHGLVVDRQGGAHVEALGLRSCPRAIVSEVQVVGNGPGVCVSDEGGPADCHGYAFDLRESRVWATGVRVGLQPYWHVLIGSNAVGLGLRDSTAYLAGSVVEGQSKQPPGSSRAPVAGESAARVHQSSLELRRSTVVGGNGHNATGGFGLELEDAIVTAWADAAVAGGTDQEGEQAQDPVLVIGSGELLRERAVLPTLAAPARAEPGETVVHELRGNAGAGALLLASLGIGPALDVGGVAGTLHLELGTLAVVAETVLDGSGAAEPAVVVPPQPGLSGRWVALQGLERFEAGGTRALALSNPAVVLVE